MFTLEKRTASRKFVDLIQTAASKLANWEPSIAIEAGDYGSLNRETGQFERQGNIYKEIEIVNITSKFPPVIGPVIDTYQVASLAVKKLDTDYSVDSEPDGTPNVIFSGKWKFGRTRGALLLMHQSRITRLPDELLHELKASNWAQGKHIVTHVHTCPGYVLYLSAKNNEILCVNLRTRDPSALSSSCAINGAGVYWTANGVSGTFQKAFAAEPVFVPLYQVKELKTRGESRREAHNQNGLEEAEWEPIDVSWNVLDEDGQERSLDFEEDLGECDTDRQD